MPHVNVRITREGATREQKAELIRGITEVLERVLGKKPASTFVVIDEIAHEDLGGRWDAGRRLAKAEGRLSDGFTGSSLWWRRRDDDSR